ncbi:MAG: hypothetical protein IJR63_00970 [Synergistaceae bacterium]|nr:hypothetical protein [Synergistaceae bacterium]
MGLRDFLARRFSHKVSIYRIDDFSIEPPQTVSMIKRVDTVRVKPEISCPVSRPYDFEEITESCRKRVRAVNVKMTVKDVKAKNYRLKHYVKEDIKTHRHKLFRTPRTSSMLKQSQALPLELPNVLRYMKKRPDTLRSEVILACYGPIVEGGVLKLALNKQRGTLLVWYKPGSRQLKAKYLYLIRRLGLGGKPEWRWE